MAPELILFAMMAVGFVLYAVMGGADFGAGIWEFTGLLHASKEEQELTNKSMGPIWETNHVWLIFVVVVLFSAFPAAFAGISRALWAPLLLGLAGIVFRGTGFALRYYAAGEARLQQVWGQVFAFASILAPFFLGAAAGAVASGALDIDARGRFHGDYLTGWLTPFSMYIGLFSVGLCAYLAAVYLTRDASRENKTELIELWRKRGLATGLWMGVLALVGLAMLATGAPALWAGFVARSWPLAIASGAAGVFSLWALHQRHFSAASVGSAAAVATVVAGWALAQYPVLLPPDVTVEDVKAPDTVLWAMIYAVCGGALILVPSLIYLFYVFKGAQRVNT